ncbi:MAG: hypothetical protein NVSMB56_18040 [Pyrinomonadaceae bacterium]
MSTPNNNATTNGHSDAPPSLQRDATGEITNGSVADVIQWFLQYDQRVSVIRYPPVEEVFQWKQTEDNLAGEDIFHFDTAEDRLAVGIFQAVMMNDTEQSLHDWIGQLLNALDEASKTNEQISSDYKLDIAASSPIAEANKIPTAATRDTYLTCCWLETLCTAEIRVLGWIYQELYKR